MPLPYSDISAVTVNHIVPEIVDEYYKVSPVFVLILKGETMRPFPGGNQIQQPIQYAPLKAGPFAPGGTFDISYVQTDTAMTFNVKYYYANVTIQGTQLPLNRGDEAIMSFVEEKMVNGSQALAQALATDIYNDGQGVVSSQIALDGLLAGYDDGTNYPSYGGLARAAIGSGANTGINGYYQNVGGPLSLTALQKAYGQATFGNRQPNGDCCRQIPPFSNLLISTDTQHVESLRRVEKLSRAALGTRADCARRLFHQVLTTKSENSTILEGVAWTRSDREG